MISVISQNVTTTLRRQVVPARNFAVTFRMLRKYAIQKHWNQETQHRFYSTGQDPFEILGVSKEDKYIAIKRTFLKLAMKNHPDTASFESEEEKAKSVERFMFIRSAFESIVETEDGYAEIAKKKGDDSSFESWFYEETGHEAPDPFSFQLDPDTLREVAEMREVNQNGGLDRGGMWAMATMVTQGLDISGGLKKPMKLEQGEIKTKSTNEFGEETMQEKPKIRRRRRNN